MPAGYSFRPSAWALAAAALACTAFILLGNWQTRRAAEKRALGAQAQSVSVTGTFVPRYSVMLDNKLRQGKPGYEVVTPLRLPGGDLHVLVNRGWVQAPPTRDVLPEVRTPSGEVRIEGVALEHLPRLLNLDPNEKGRVRQNVDLPAFAAETGLRLEPRIIEQHSTTDDGLLREWPRLDTGVEKNESYALQWYSFAALAVILALVFSFRKN
jgi:cytochrome oxidase assembly protein ShyY1